MQSAVLGLKETFTLANNICEKTKLRLNFLIEIYTTDEILQNQNRQQQKNRQPQLHVIIIPPSINGDYYLKPDQAILDWLHKHHARGGVVCSVCAGTFILAATKLLQNREATTHWGLTTEFMEHFPQVLLNTNKILINDGDIITAGGLMSWMDLGLELVAQFTNTGVMRKLGKTMVIDTGQREQRYYQSFSPKLDHGDANILNTQHFIQANYNQPVSIATLSRLCSLGERTFLRRFVKATGIKPIQYLQRIRIQKACDLIESTNNTFDVISLKVGYEDSSAFRKTFVKIIGLTPKEFKNRFVNNRIDNNTL